MAKDIKKDTKEHPEEKNAEIKRSCGCGCSLLSKKK